MHLAARFNIHYSVLVFNEYYAIVSWLDRQTTCLFPLFKMSMFHLTCLDYTTFPKGKGFSGGDTWLSGQFQVICDF